ncbi:MAG TPA: hypothetical protein VKY73_08490, partial [Polyangiaceae bacterium]|nr:hypothetical protein [Polyangiaceae bacterium]
NAPLLHRATADERDDEMFRSPRALGGPIIDYLFDFRNLRRAKRANLGNSARECGPARIA